MFLRFQRIALDVSYGLNPVIEHKSACIFLGKDIDEGNASDKSIPFEITAHDTCYPISHMEWDAFIRDENAGSPDTPHFTNPFSMVDFRAFVTLNVDEINFSANPTLHHIKTRKMYRDIFFIKVSLTPLFNEVTF